MAHSAPAARWDFSGEESTRLVPHGGVHRDVPGPRPPEFPDFEVANTAVQLDGAGSYLALDDPGTGSPFDFTNGDSIALEAWVKIDELEKGANTYIVGKGRTGAEGFAPDNQNWALRLREQRGQACVSFLFATVPVSGVAKSDTHWHRWTAGEGFAAKSGWHYLAVSYRFGEPDSLRAWVDGGSLAGAWDMGGATREAPVVDDDAVWIGSAQGGRATNSFRGAVDALVIHREALDDAAIRSRYTRGDSPVAAAAPETMPDLGPLPPGKVLATFHEGMPSHDRWLGIGETWPAEITRWESESFLLPRLPLRYDAWGIRAAWKSPVLVRLAADVTLPPGKHRIVLRARGLSRLWVDGKVVARTVPQPGSRDGEEPMTPVATPPLPGLRHARHDQQEVFGEFEVAANSTCRVVLETLAGGKMLRAETGELCVAIATGDGRSFSLLQPQGPSIALTDAEVDSALCRIQSSLGLLDDLTRRSAAASGDAFWEMRRAAARTWALENPPPAVPTVRPHPIDAFLAVKMDNALAASAKNPIAEARKFHDKVLPILREECFRCHGDKAKGDLRLDTREAVLKGGGSEIPAVVPGDPKASELMTRILTDDSDERMPPKGDGLKHDQIAALETWIKDGAAWPAPPVTAGEIAAPPVIGDAAFLRRVYLDTVGVPPTEPEVRAFLTDTAPAKRELVIDRLLDDVRHTDHWMSYWQDVLAENPTLINFSLNTTGPFRWFIQEALRDGKPMDRFVTELLLLRGSVPDGGSAGFGVAGDNLAPLAAKGHIVGTAFLGVEMQCATCHDSPYHSTKQRDLYSLAAMLDRKPVTVPKTNSVPAAFFEKKGRASLIKVTLKPGEAIEPVWPFAKITGRSDDTTLDALVQTPGDPRERLAALVTAPQNTRFAQVMVNRVWRRLMGAGIVEPPQDWEGHPPSHPEMLGWLAHEFVSHGYDLKHIERLVLTSRTYQLEATGKNLIAGPELRFFNAPERRRLSAEQVVDSLFTATGRAMDIEELTFNPDGRRQSEKLINLGTVDRAWKFANLANERDRPSLSLPRATAVADVLQAFGWSGARQVPRTDRESEPNVLQPGVLANSTLSVSLTRAAQDSALADLAVNAASPSALVESVFFRMLGRPPTAAESAPFVAALGENFATRITSGLTPAAPLPELPRVTWSNHLQAESTAIAMEWERRSRAGPPPDVRLESAWREVFEDFVWSVVNTREFVWIP